MNIKEAAERLLKKGAITQDEFNIVKNASIENPFGDLLKSITPKVSLSAKTSRPAMGPALAKSLPWIQGGLYAALGASILKQLMSPAVDKVKANMSFNKLIEKNPVLAERDPDQIKDYFNVIETFSPKAASNPLVAGALVNKMMEFGGVDHKLVQDLASIQSGIQRADAIEQLSGAAARSLFPTATNEFGGNIDLSGTLSNDND